MVKVFAGVFGLIDKAVRRPAGEFQYLDGRLSGTEKQQIGSYFVELAKPTLAKNPGPRFQQPAEPDGKSTRPFVSRGGRPVVTPCRLP